MTIVEDENKKFSDKDVKITNILKNMEDKLSKLKCMFIKVNRENLSLLGENDKLKMELKNLKNERKQLNKILSKVRLKNKSVDSTDCNSDSSSDNAYVVVGNMVDDSSDDVVDGSSDDVVDGSNVDSNTTQVNNTNDDILLTWASVCDYLVITDKSLSTVLYECGVSKVEKERYRYNFSKLRLERNEIAHPEVTDDKKIYDSLSLLKVLQTVF
jgi:hypothetical protein